MYSLPQSAVWERVVSASLVGSYDMYCMYAVRGGGEGEVRVRSVNTPGREKRETEKGDVSSLRRYPLKVLDTYAVLVAIQE